MSKIEKELVDATGLKTKRGQDRQEFLRDLAKAVNELPDKDFNALSEDADNWVNAAFDAMEAKKDVPDFPDAAKEEAPTGRSRRGAAKEEAPAKDKAEYEPAVGDVVTAVMKRGKGTFTGEIVEMDEEVLVLDVDGKDEELVRSRIETLSLDDGEPSGGDGAYEPKVGDVVTVVNKRGKEFTGEIVELSESELVLDVDGKDEVLARGRIETIKPQGGKGSATKEEAPAGRSRRGAAKEEAPAKGGRSGRSTSKGEGNVSVGTRIRQLCIEAYKDDGKIPTVEALNKALTKEGYDVKDNTLALNHSEVTKMFQLLEDADLLK